MSSSIGRSMRSRVSAALVVGVAALGILPGCDSAPPAGSLDMGGKEGKNTIRPGELKAPDAPEKPAGKTPAGRSIKELPSSTP
jgi:hypothetical protein